MRNLIDSVFAPVIGWLQMIIDNLRGVSVPLSRPFDLSNYVGYVSIFGPYWEMFVKQALLLLVVYLITYVVINNMGLIIKFKDMIKWW